MLPHPLRTSDARPLGVVIALPVEAKTFQRATGPGIDVVIVGPGPVRAASGARALLDRGAGALLSWGTSGALVPGLPAGQLLLADAVRDEAGAEFASDADWLACVARTLRPLGPRRVRCVTVAQPASHLRAKERLAAASGCVAVDMESAAVAASAATAQLPFLAIRSIVDPVDCDLPRCVMAGLDHEGHTHVLRLLASLARRPWEIVGLLALARHFNASLRALREAARLLSVDMQPGQA